MTHEVYTEMAAVRLEGAAVRNLLKQVQELDDAPIKLPIQGLLRNICKKILPYEVFVDKWPDYSVIVAKPAPDHVKVLPTYRLGIYTTKPACLSKVLCQPRFLPRTVPIRIFGVPVTWREEIEKTATNLNMDVRWIKEEDKRYFVSSTNLKRAEEILAQKPSDFYCNTIDAEKYGEQIASMWRYWPDHYDTLEEAIAVTKYYMKTGLSLGMYEKGSDTLASWMINYVDRSSMMGHTLPQYRRMGLLWSNMCEVLRRSVEIGDTFYGYVAHENPIAAQGVLKMGGTVHYDAIVMHCVMKPKYSRL